MNLHTLTLNEIKDLQKERLAELISFAGTNKHLAFMLNKPLPTINGWCERGRISKDGAKEVEQHEKLGGKFKAEYLRPDISINS